MSNIIQFPTPPEPPMEPADIAQDFGPYFFIVQQPAAAPAPPGPSGFAKGLFFVLGTVAGFTVATVIAAALF